MIKRNMLLDENEKERVMIESKVLLIPTILQIPEDLKDRLPLAQVLRLEGRFIFRFYMPVAIGHTITHRGHRWRIIGVDHGVLVKGSPGQDVCPELGTEYIGE